MLKITQAVIVEGKYDKIKLSNIIDAFIIETNGFSIFKDKDKMRFIKQLADKQGIVVLTDSDHAGFMIRNYIASGVPKDKITHVYIPDIAGKEKRKDTPSKEGKLGVEGMTKDVILKAFEKANIQCKEVVKDNPIITADLFQLGYSGTPNAKQNKKKLLEKLQLPEFLSTNSLLSCLNSMMSKEEFYHLSSTIK